MPIALSTGTNLKIEFNHDTIDVEVNGKVYPQRQRTTCALIASDGENKPEVIGVGVATRYYKDTNNLRVARKTALKDAMNQAGLTREQRSTVWNSGVVRLT